MLGKRRAENALRFLVAEGFSPEQLHAKSAANTIRLLAARPTRTSRSGTGAPRTSQLRKPSVTAFVEGQRYLDAPLGGEFVFRFHVRGRAFSAYAVGKIVVRSWVHDVRAVVRGIFAIRV